MRFLHLGPNTFCGLDPETGCKAERSCAFSRTQLTGHISFSQTLRPTAVSGQSELKLKWPGNLQFINLALSRVASNSLGTPKTLPGGGKGTGMIGFI